jgi:penicillin-binding protein 1A
MRNRRLFPAGVAFALFVSLATACDLPELADYDPLPLAQTTFLYAADGSLITELHATEDRVVLRKDEMAPALRDAAVAIEDRRFFFHHGVDARAIARAAYVNAAEGVVVEGGSTITQQLVKILYVGTADTLRRKLDEASLAWQLEDQLSKDQILTRYLNTIYFGQGAYGAQAAAQTYFSVDAEDLSVAQSALLAGLISAPNHFDPFVQPEAAYGRRNVVLRVMRELGFIDTPSFRQAVREPIELERGGSTTRYPYPYFVDYFKEWFLTNPAFGQTRQDRYKRLFTGGLRITTTLDPRLQTLAQTAVRSVLAYPDDPDGAMTVIDPRTGFVRAMVGGDDADYWRGADAGRVNLATGKGGRYGRQTGSAFKPFALVAALERGISPETTFAAPASIDIPLDGGRVWHVTNAEGSGYGTMSLANATIDSVNTVYAQLMQQVGPENVIETATRMGLRCCTRSTSPKTPLEPNLSAVLGTNGTNTLSMAAAYGTLATGGRRTSPVPVVSVGEADGTLVWQAEPAAKQVIDPQVASVADSILQDAVLIGTGTSANIGRPQIGKTGTADTHTNAWFVGAIPQLTAAVWVGFSEGLLPMEPPRTRITVFGGTWPAQIWRLFMLRAADGLPERPFPTPQVGYMSVAVDLTQSPYCLPNAYTLPQNIGTLQFIVGTEPTKPCRTPTRVQSVSVPSVIGMTQASAESALSEAGFYLQVEVADSTQPAGTVLYQDPAAGTSALQTSTVTITVSTVGAGSG